MIKEATFKNLNKTPVRTKSWLKANDVTLNDFEAPSLGQFNNVKITSNENNGVKIEKIENGTKMPISKKYEYGVSEELINQGETEFNQGYVITVPKNVKAKELITIEFELDKENLALVDNIIVVAEENSEANIMIKYTSKDDSVGYHNGLLNVISKEHSNVKVTKINLLNKNTLNLDSSQSEVKYYGNVEYLLIDLGGKYSITNYHGDLSEENANGTLDSIYIGGNKKVIDMNYVMTHKGRRTTSNMEIKGALKDEANKIFRGTLDFKKGASRSKGAEEEFCMILSPTVKSKAIPLLLCHEDDVSGEHAAASGRIDEDKLFYLMSRGLSYNDARRVVIEGAFNPIIDKVENEEVKEEILRVIKECLDNE